MDFPHDATHGFLEELAQTPALTAPRRRAIERVRSLLQRPLRLGIFGEPGSGKSLLINVLLRQAIFPPGVLGGVRPLTLVRYGRANTLYSVTEKGARHRLTSKAMLKAASGSHEPAEEPHVIYKARDASARHGAPARRNGIAGTSSSAPVAFLELHLDLPFLKEFEILEVPGRAAASGLPELAKRAIREVNLSLWLTSAAQAWKRSEATLWEGLRPTPAGASLLVVNHKDSLGAQDRARLALRLEKETAALFSDRVMVSLKQAHNLLVEGQDRGASCEDCGITELTARIDNLGKAIKEHRLRKAMELCARLRAVQEPQNATGPFNAACRPRSTRLSTESMKGGQDDR